jgi:hypothetical protein
MRKTFLEDVETTHADDGFDLTRLDHLTNDGRALGYQDRIAETICFHGEVLD